MDTNETGSFEDERFRALWEQTHVAMSFSSLDGTVIGVNPAACELLGRTERDLVGRPVNDLIHPDDQESSSSNLQALIDGSIKALRVERRFVRGDGAVVWGDASTQAIRGPDGRPRYWQSVIVDITERALQQARFAALLEAAPDAIVGVDQSDGITLVTARAEQLFGYRRDQLVGEQIELLFPKHVAAVNSGGRAPFSDDLALGKMVVAEIVGQRSDGTEFPAEVSLSIFDAADERLILVGVRDGAERQQAAIVQSSADAIIGRNLDGMITSWNSGAEAIYGYSAAQAVGTDMSVLVPLDRQGELEAVTARMVRGERVNPFETQRICRDGTVLDVSVTVSPIHDEAGTIIGSSAVARDITSTKRAVDALQASEARKAAIVESALDCVISIDDSGLITEFNPTAERVFGFSRGEAIGQPMAELIIPLSLRDLHYAGVAHYLETGDGPILGKRVEINAIRRDGTEFPVELSVARVDLPGPPIFTAYLRDMTDEVQVKVERQALADRLQQSQRLESLGQLAGGVAHDFNNLLAVILNYASFVAEQTVGNDAVQGDVEQIQAAAKRAADLTNQLLIFGRRETVRPEVLDLNSVVADMHNLLSGSIGEHVELVCHPSAAALTMKADRGQIEQVVLNLAVNARDAMTDGGRLTIETRHTDLDREYCRLHPEVRPGSFVELSVSDTGTGMTPAVAARIFEPFFTTKPQLEGSGLGLAIVYGIVTEAGGSISVYSEVGTGSTFRLFFPASGRTVAAGQSVPAAKTQGDGQTILVVEDEPAMMEVTARILSRNGYEVIRAPTGAEALEVAARQHVDLLLTDSVMPRMSGRELAEHFRELKPHVPVLFMSGYSQGVLGPQRIVDDDIALIQKPFNESELLEYVRRSLTRTERSGDRNDSA